MAGVVIKASEKAGSSVVERTQTMYKELITPMHRCLTNPEIASCDRDVIVSGGRKLTSSLLQLVARAVGCSVFYTNEKGEAPRLWSVREPERLAEQDPLLLTAGFHDGQAPAGRPGR
jgi:hypothetical protein